MAKPNGCKRAYAVFALCAAMAITLPAQTFTRLHEFSGKDGSGPGGLVQATDGSFYEITGFGGTSVCNTNGGPPGCGTIFKFTAGFSMLHSFNGMDGQYPDAALVQATAGNFYGTTRFGGTGCTTFSPPGCGTIFRITASGTLTTLHRFNGTDGEYPVGLVQATDGNFYGTTSGDGIHSDGTVFKITPSGALTTLHRFNGTDGGNPMTALVQGTDGNLYGTTGDLYGAAGGTVFKITPSGTLTTLHIFSGMDGLNPTARLVQATDGNFYGTTSLGGTTFCVSFLPGCGTIFRITPSGTLTTLHSFVNDDGWRPGALVQGTNGDFYGTAVQGPGTRYNPQGYGTVFRLSVGLGPFVETRPTSGDVADGVEILGSDLTGATSVSFNGTAAVFTVVSATEITAIVPVGATSGKVKVVTPGGTLSSNVPFRVLP